MPRLSLSHFPRRRASQKSIIPRWARKSFRGTARFASRIPSSAMGVGANKLTTNITIGSWFAAVFATAAARPSPSCRRFLRRTAITASSLAARRYGVISCKAVAGKLPHPLSKIRIAWRIPPPYADGFALWILPSRLFLLCAGRWWPYALGWTGPSYSFITHCPCAGTLCSRFSRSSGPCGSSSKLRLPPSLPGNTAAFRLLSTQEVKTAPWPRI